MNALRFDRLPVGMRRELLARTARDMFSSPVNLEALPKWARRQMLHDAAFTSLQASLIRMPEKDRRCLQEKAFLDPLTNLLNKRGFNLAYDRFLSIAVRHNRPVVVGIIDLDFFKTVNDRYGHPAGDRLLTQVAQAIQGALRQTDIIARWGGEEFAVLLDETSRDQAEVPLRRVRERIAAEPFLIGGERVELTVSIGYTFYQPEPNDARLKANQIRDLGERLFKKADQALYCSKDAGRNRISWLP